MKLKKRIRSLKPFTNVIYCRTRVINVRSNVLITENQKEENIKLQGEERDSKELKKKWQILKIGNEEMSPWKWKPKKENKTNL